MIPKLGLSLEHACLLARSAFGPDDLIECGAVGLTPYASLMYGRDAGPVWTLYEDALFDKPVGCGGFGKLDRSIWAYFLPLTPVTQHDLAKNAVGWIRKLVENAGPGHPLHNCVWEENHKAIAWLRATHCFKFLDYRIRSGHNAFIPFECLPLEEMPNV